MMRWPIVWSLSSLRVCWTIDAPLVDLPLDDESTIVIVEAEKGSYCICAMLSAVINAVISDIIKNSKVDYQIDGFYTVHQWCCWVLIFVQGWMRMLWRMKLLSSTRLWVNDDDDDMIMIICNGSICRLIYLVNYDCMNAFDWPYKLWSAGGSIRRVASHTCSGDITARCNYRHYHQCHHHLIYSASRSSSSIAIGYGYDPTDVKIAIKKLLVRRLREMVLQTGRRSDGRAVDEVRPISMEVDLLPGTNRYMDGCIDR